MPTLGSTHPPPTLPPTDHVARVLLKLGARDEALTLLKAAIARDPGEKACAALLRAVEARPDASVYGPDLRLSLGLVEAYVQRSMLIEALAVLRGGKLDRGEQGEVLCGVLKELLVPAPDDSEPWLLDVDHHVRTGGAAVALTMLDHAALQGWAMPPWAVRHRTLLHRLLFESAVPLPTDPGLDEPGLSPLGEALSPHLSARDLPGARSAAERYCREHPEDSEADAAAECLTRLVEAMRAASEELGPSSVRTQPMSADAVALLQFRMGNLEVAERLFRRIVLDAPLDELARQRLDDMQLLRRALQEGSSPTPGVPPLDLRRESRDPPTGSARPSARAPSEEGFPRRPAQKQEERTRRAAHPAEGPKPVSSSPPQRLTRPGVPDPRELETAKRVMPVPPAARGTLSTPLQKKSRPTAGDAGAWNRVDTYDEDDSTAVGSPESLAELMLKQGYAERALRIFMRLSERKPNDRRLTKRLEEVREIVARGRGPAPPASSRPKKSAPPPKSAPPRIPTPAEVMPDMPSTLRMPGSGPPPKPPETSADPPTDIPSTLRMPSSGPPPGSMEAGSRAAEIPATRRMPSSGPPLASYEAGAEAAEIPSTLRMPQSGPPPSPVASESQPSSHPPVPERTGNGPPREPELPEATASEIPPTLRMGQAGPAPDVEPDQDWDDATEVNPPSHVGPDGCAEDPVSVRRIIPVS